MSAVHTIIKTDAAPAAIGPYSQAVRVPAAAVGDTVYISGCIGLLPSSNPSEPPSEFAAADVVGQTEQSLKNMAAVLAAAGGTFSNVVKTTVLLRDMGDFQEVNKVYAKYFDGQDPPARACCKCPERVWREKNLRERLCGALGAVGGARGRASRRFLADLRGRAACGLHVSLFSRHFP